MTRSAVHLRSRDEEVGVILSTSRVNLLQYSDHLRVTDGGQRPVGPTTYAESCNQERNECDCTGENAARFHADHLRFGQSSFGGWDLVSGVIAPTAITAVLSSSNRQHTQGGGSPPLPRKRTLPSSLTWNIHQWR